MANQQSNKSIREETAMHSNIKSRRAVAAAALLFVAVLAALSTVALAKGLEVNEKLTFKAGESKIEREGQLDSSKPYVYLIHADAGQRLNVAAIFRGNITPKESKPNAVFRGNFVLDLRGPRSSDGGEAPRVADFNDGDTKWSGTIKESGDYLIIISRPAQDESQAEGADKSLRYTLRVSLN
jgi:hypothetical protein